MIKSKENKKVGIEIDLTGPDGNAYAILGLAKRLCREFGIPFSDKQGSGHIVNGKKVYDS